MLELIAVPFDRHVATRNGELLHVGWIHPPFVGIGHRNHPDPNHSRTKCIVMAAAFRPIIYAVSGYSRNGCVDDRSLDRN
jgi:hypothetical protein